MIIIVVTNWDSHLISKEAIRKGADDFFIKTEKHTLLKAMLENLLAAAQQQDETLSADYPGLVVHAPAMQAVLADARKVARLNYTVLISGESGSGKEVVARYIHDHSRRREGPFVAVNCAAIPESLFESELFGHERGSFTGASQTRQGWFEAAQKGTLFLDEIAELPVTKQATLLRVLQEKRIEHIGTQRSISLDIR
ncbi:MAG: sigma-54 factor interaction domain-containing protein, partial [Calditrichaeota bacterium]|nr:sigma-54 factor interaction domain-containing protein [Calditrichota bacterium]